MLKERDKPHVNRMGIPVFLFIPEVYDRFLPTKDNVLQWHAKKKGNMES